MIQSWQTQVLNSVRIFCSYNVQFSLNVAFWLQNNFFTFYPNAFVNTAGRYLLRVDFRPVILSSTTNGDRLLTVLVSYSIQDPRFIACVRGPGTLFEQWIRLRPRPSCDCEDRVLTTRSARGPRTGTVPIPYPLRKLRQRVPPSNRPDPD